MAVALVTGFPLDVARRTALDLAAGGDHVYLLARAKFAGDAAELGRRAATDANSGGKIEVLEGDIVSLDLGLTGSQVRRLHADLDEVHHIAAITYLGIAGARMRQVNVEGVREVLEFALGARHLRRLCLWSTVFVAGDRSGVVREDELLVGQHFRNDYEATKAQAEQLARAAMRHLPITIVRPSIVIGDSTTGELGRLDGPYLLVKAIVRSPPGRAIPLPGRGDFALHLVPIDFAVRAAIHLARHPAAVGGTFHLVDDRPLAARAFFGAVADAAGRPRPHGLLPARLARAVLNLPLLRSRVRGERTFIEWFDTDVRFDNRGARALLHPDGIACPAVPTYVDALVRHVRERG